MARNRLTRGPAYDGHSFNLVLEKKKIAELSPTKRALIGYYLNSINEALGHEDSDVVPEELTVRGLPLVGVPKAALQ